MKDVRDRRDDDDRENGTNGDDHKGDLGPWNRKQSVQLISRFSSERHGYSYPCKRRSRYCGVVDFHRVRCHGSSTCGDDAVFGRSSTPGSIGNEWKVCKKKF